MAVLVLSATSWLASPAGAQDPNDPYGPTSTTGRPPRTATIELSVTSGPRGTQVEAYACGYVPGASGGSITFSGEVVASGLTAAADGCLVTVAGSPPRFVVPEDSRPGTHHVCAVVAGYNTPCARFRVTNQQERGRGSSDTEVQGVALERGADGSGAPGSSDGATRVLGVSLPRTGLAVGLLVAVALALIVGGRALLDGSRRRRPSAPR